MVPVVFEKYSSSDSYVCIAEIFFSRRTNMTEEILEFLLIRIAFTKGSKTSSAKAKKYF
jgi:hypothetical protein